MSVHETKHVRRFENEKIKKRGCSGGKYTVGIFAGSLRNFRNDSIRNSSIRNNFRHGGIGDIRYILLFSDDVFGRNLYGRYEGSDA